MTDGSFELSSIQPFTSRKSRALVDFTDPEYRAVKTDAQYQ